MSYTQAHSKPSHPPPSPTTPPPPLPQHPTKPAPLHTQSHLHCKRTHVALHASHRPKPPATRTWQQAIATKPHTAVLAALHMRAVAAAVCGVGAVKMFVEIVREGVCGHSPGLRCYVGAVQNCYVSGAGWSKSAKQRFTREWTLINPFNATLSSLASLYRRPCLLA